MLRIKKKEKGVLIQKRDIDILKFCLEMKFADIESLNQLFFDAEKKDMFGARKRVHKLELSGYLKSFALLQGTSKKFYLTTAKGCREVLKFATNKYTLNPVSKLSIVTFEHDYGVLRARLLLEKQNRAYEWEAERLLKNSSFFASGKIRREFMPDAIFKNKQGITCAFEYENKPKTTEQLNQKVLRLKSLMDEDSPVFSAGIFVTSTESLKNKVLKITSAFPNRFVVISFNELLEPKNGING